MKTRGTYALLALFFAGLVALWWADASRIPTRRKREEMSSRVLPGLIDVKPDDLEKIEILGGPKPLIFVRNAQGSGWQMTSPLNVEADPSKVETLAYNLKELSRKPEAATIQSNAAQFGLDRPSKVIRLWGKDRSEPLASLDVGLESEKLGRLFVRATGTQGVEVIESRSLALLKLLPERWRDHELFRVPSFEVDGISLKSGGSELKIQRRRDAWRIDSPVQLLAAEPRVDGLIADLGSLRVIGDDRFVADDVPEADFDRYGLKEPRLTIEVDAGRSSRRRPPQILYVGKPVPGKNDQVYVRKEGQDDILAVDARVLKDLKVDPNPFRSPKVADIRPNRVTKIAVDEPGGGFELVRLPNLEWSIVRPSTLKADRKAVEEFLKSLDKLETSTFLSPESIVDSGLDSSTPSLKIWELTDPRDPSSKKSNPDSSQSDGELVVNLQIGRRDAGRRSIFARIAGDRTILALPDSAAEFLPRSVLAFRDHQILNEAIDPIQRIKFVGGDRQFIIQSPPLKLDPFRGAPLGWWMVDPVDAPADAPTVGALLRVLAGLRAESLVTETPNQLENYGLKTPALTLTWSSLPPPFSMVAQATTLPGQGAPIVAKTEHSLLVGSIVPNKPSSRFAKLADAPLIFTIGPEVLAILDTEYHDHHVLSFKPERVRKIHFDWAGRGFAVQNSNQSEKPGWSFVGPVDAADFDLNEINTLLKSTSDLSTARYTQYLGEFPAFAGLKPARLTIRYELDDGTNPRILRIGVSDRKNRVFATTETGPAGPMFLLPEAIFQPWLKSPRNSGDLPENVFAP